MDSFIGSILPCAFSFAPRGWAPCNGQLLPIQQNQALFALLGTSYGGDGRTTFALPDLRGTVAIHPPQFSPYPGSKGGVDRTTLLTSQMPAHSHQLAGGTIPTVSSPAGAYPGPDGNYTSDPATTTLSSGALAPAGGQQPFSVMKPYTTMNFVIALQGYWPQRD